MRVNPITVQKPEAYTKPLDKWFKKLIDDQFTPKFISRSHIRVEYQESKHCLHLKKQYTFGYYFCDTCWAQTNDSGEWFGGIYAPIRKYTANPYEDDCHDL